MKTTTPKSITRNDTKGNDANDELPAHNAINYSKNDCTIAPVITTNTKNYDAKNAGTMRDDTRNGDTNDEITYSLKEKYFGTIVHKKKALIINHPDLLFTVYISRDQGVQSFFFIKKT